MPQTWHGRGGRSYEGAGRAWRGRHWPGRRRRRESMRERDPRDTLEEVDRVGFSFVAVLLTPVTLLIQ